MGNSTPSYGAELGNVIAQFWCAECGEKTKHAQGCKRGLPLITETAKPKPTLRQRFNAWLADQFESFKGIS
jgi:hypothetical protein